MARYNRRDLFAHWVRKDEPKNRPCQHACCRGMRPHPEGYPVVKRRAYLKSRSDSQLMAEYERHPGEDRRAEAYRAQVLAEAQRRDIAQERRERAEERRRAAWAESRTARHSERERLFAQAETATTGYMVNRRGREAGVDPRSLFTGRESRVRKYASDELLEYFERNPGARLDYRQAGIRARVSDEERAWRDAYDRDGLDLPAIA